MKKRHSVDTFKADLAASSKFNKRGVISHKFKIDWRSVWFSVLIWILAILVSTVVILPWYYLVMPFIVFWTTVIYFRRGEKTLLRGLWIALFWFFVIGALDFFEFVGPYYNNAPLYFSDFRNSLKYPLILLIPVIYSLILENINLKHTRRKVRKMRPTLSSNTNFPALR